MTLFPVWVVDGKESEPRHERCLESVDAAHQGYTSNKDIPCTRCGQPLWEGQAISAADEHTIVAAGSLAREGKSHAEIAGILSVDEAKARQLVEWAKGMAREG